MAQPVNLEQKKEEADRVKKQLQSIDNELDVTVEKYNQATVNLNQTQASIKQTKENLEKTSKRFSYQRKLLNQRIVNIYKNGDINFISTLVGTKSFAHFLTRLSCLIQISNQDLKLLREIQETKEELEKNKQKLEKEEKEQLALIKELGNKRNEIERQISDRKTFLAAVEADIQTMIREEEEREARTQAEEAQRLQQQQEQRTEQNRQNNQLTQNNPNRNSPNNNQNNNRNQDNSKNGTEKPKDPPPSKPAPPKSAAHSDVVPIAMQQLGKPYQWGAAGPNAFDCSGLVMYCYAQIGISLPHSAAAQYNSGTHLSQEYLEAGDLVFFGKTGVSHVGIYVGGGKYIHAPRTGDVVKVSALSSRNDYYSACRP